MDFVESTVNHFTQGNPEGESQGNVPAMLRRVALSIEQLGDDVYIHDVVFNSENTALGPWVFATVYYSRDDGGQRSQR